MSKSKMPAERKVYSFPSRFGTHSSMVDETKSDDQNCYATDEFGSYITRREYVDSGLADPIRTATSRLGKLFEKSAKEKDKR